MPPSPTDTQLTTAFGLGFVDPQAWEQLHLASSLQGYAETWLQLLCASLQHADGAVLVLRETPESPWAPLARWPAELELDRELMQAAEASLQANQGLYRQIDSHSGRLAHPVRDLDGVRGVVALRLRVSEPSPLAMRQLQWGLNGLQLALLRHDQGSDGDQRLQPLLETVQLILIQQGLRAAADAFTARIAGLLDCRRVSLGLTQGVAHRLLSLSHSVGFTERNQLARSLEGAMDEAGDLARVVHFRPGGEGADQLYPWHGRLSGNQGGHHLLSIPFGDGQRLFGCLVLERDHAFDERTQLFAESAIDLCGPILELQRLRELGPMQRLSALLRGQQTGSRHGTLGWSLGLLLLLALTTALTLVDGRFRIAADALVEARHQQAVVAPMDGFIREAPRRAGDRIQAGELLYRLDDADLLLEQAKLEQQLEQTGEKYRNALAGRQRTEIAVLKAQLQQTEAQLDLTRRQLQRSRGLAPADGVIVSGDLSQQQGAPVRRGEVLFEVAPLGDFQLMLEVDERDIALIAPGQSGELVLASAAGASLGFEVKRITPVSRVQEGRNIFRVEGRLDDANGALLQPGMKGVAKVEVGERPLGWIWSREMVNWLRLWFWSWLP